MEIIKLNSKNKQQALRLAVLALRQGKTVVYPTDTTYGLGAAALKPIAVNKIYKIKLRQKKQPIHVLVPSVAYAKKILVWNATAQKLALKFLPGALSIALPLKNKKSALNILTAKSGYLGIRVPKNGFAIELAKKMAAPITATSANPSGYLAGGYDPYSAEDVINQFRNRKHHPDLIIDAGRLPKNKPSTFIRITGDIVEILRQGPVSRKQIQSVL